MKKLLFFSLLLITGIFGCREDIDMNSDATSFDSPPVIIDEYDPTQNLISGTVTGIIFDEDDAPVENAVVKLRGTSYTTDSDGYFIAEDVTLDAEGTFFTVEKNGYFKGSRRFYPRENAISYTKVQLMQLNEIGTFPSNTATEINGADGIKLSFPADGIKKADGTLYSGDVTVSAKWLDPTADNVTELMPGNLFGLNNRIEEVALATYGMMAVELFGENGESLNVADGKKVALSFPLPADMALTAPDEIPLWSFEDAQYGIWVEEGKATRQGDFYVGEVSHFSFWNCDAPFPIVFLEGRLVTATGAPISDAIVKVSVASSNICGYGVTDSDGYFSGKMPKDEILNITAGSTYDACDFESAQVGPFSVDTDMGELQLDAAGSAFDVTGSVVDCMGAPVTNGRVKIVVGTKLTTVFLDSSNVFTIGVLNCDNESDFVIRADDLENGEGSGPATFAIAPSVDVGAIQACGNSITEFFTLTVDGETHTYPTGTVFFEIPSSADYLFMSVGDSSTGNPNGANIFSMTMPNGALGTYDTTGVDYLQLTVSPPDYSQFAALNCFPQQGGCSDITTFEINITVNEGLGGNLEGNFSGTGTFNDDMGVPYANEFDFSGSWRLPIMQ